MKILVAADMEGITGVVMPDHVNPHHTEYGRFRRLMTADVNAAVEGALNAGVREVVVTDGHWNGDNILLEELHPRALLNSGSPAPYSMLQGIETGVSGVLFIGYHARAGTASAILDHTFSGAVVANLWLNDILVGETGLNAALAGHFGVPVLLVSGDQSVCAEAQELLGEVETAVVKRASGRNAAECLGPAASQELIRHKAERAVRRLAARQAVAPYQLTAPIRVRLEFNKSSMADRAIRMPGAVRTGGREITLEAPDMPAAHAVFRAAVLIGRE